MKSLFSLLLLTILAIHATAQGKQHVYGYAINKESVEWYQNQQQLWKAELQLNPQNSYAWYNYYRATRNLSRTDSADKRPQHEKNQALTSLIEDMEKAVPNSFEYNLCKWMHGGNDYEKLMPYLRRAYELGPDREELISDLIVWAELDRDIPRRDAHALRWFNSSMNSPGMLYYNYNVLVGVKPNAILITQGDNDTYPIWQLQSKGIRKDILVLNTSLLRIDAYRKKIFTELGIKDWDLSRFKDNPAGLESWFHNELIGVLASNTAKRPIYVGITCSENLTKPNAQNLYLVGLAYEYNTKNIDNLNLIRQNIEEGFALDYLDKPLYKDISTSWSDMSKPNYIPAFIKLFDYYKKTGNKQRIQWIQTKIELVCKGRPEEKETLQYIGK